MFQSFAITRNGYNFWLFRVLSYLLHVWRRVQPCTVSDSLNKLFFIEILYFFCEPILVLSCFLCH